MKRVVTLQDISCLGRCSITVALPVISAMGVECAIVPTAVLSTHTMFKGFTCCDLSDQIEPITRHWLSQGIKFDAVYTGYLASEDQCGQTVNFIKSFKTGDNMVIVDPAMADHGKLYPAFGPEFPRAMAGVCAQADLVLPNLTEAAFLTETPYQESWTDGQVKDMLEKLLALGCKSAMITGYGGAQGKTGFLAMDRSGEVISYSHELLPVSYHGTGDIFSSAVVGSLMRGLGLREAGVIAADFVSRCIEYTSAQPNAPWYGVEFEALLPELMEKLK